MNFIAKSTPKKLVALVLSAVMALSCLATGAVSTASAIEADELDPSGMKVTAVRTWVTGAAGAHAGHVKIDNYVTGSFNGVVLEPDSSYIPSTDIGKYDVKVSLSQTNNAFSKITVDDADLDPQYYSINETKDVVTISKDYIAALAGQTKVLTFHFADGYMTTFVIEVEGEVDTEQYDYVRDFSKDGKVTVNDATYIQIDLMK